MTTNSEWGGEMPPMQDEAGNWIEPIDAALYAGCSENGHGRLYAETKRVIWSWTDGDDYPNFAWLLELNDGRIAAVEGWHDYTGWDCQSGIEVVHVAATLAECVPYFSEERRVACQEANPS